MTEYIDTHTHIADEAFASDEEGYIERALAAGVGIMLQADIDSRERARMFALTDRHPGVLYPMLGLYPGSVDKGWKSELPRLRRQRMEVGDRRIGTMDGPKGCRHR